MFMIIAETCLGQIMASRKSAQDAVDKAIEFMFEDRTGVAIIDKHAAQYSPREFPAFLDAQRHRVSSGGQSNPVREQGRDDSVENLRRMAS